MSAVRSTKVEPSAQHPNGRRILIVKLGAIGDVLMVVPAARTMHDAGFEVHWLCGSAVAPLLALYSWIHTIVIDERSLFKGSTRARVRAVGSAWRKLWGSRFDLCATLYYDARYRVLTLPVRARRRVGLSWTDRGRMLIPGRHHSGEYARLLQESFSMATDGERPGSLAPIVPHPAAAPETDRRGSTARIALCPGGAKNLLRDNPLRRWPLERYVGLAQRLIGRGHRVTLIGGPDDRWVTAAFDGLPVDDRIGTLSLNQTLALLDDCDIVVTHDTGPLHLAGVSRAGIVSIFGPTDPGAFHPRRPGAVAFWGGANMSCRPCYDGRDFAPCANNGCIQQIGVEMIESAVQAMLDERCRGQLCAGRIVAVQGDAPPLP